VAFLALHYGVGAEQRKAIEVVLDGLDRDVPAEHGMALGAVGAKLAAVNVSVAIGAIFADVREDRSEVAAGAGDFFVHAAQRVARGIVIKFGDGADGCPTGVGVAVFARNIQRPMRTTGRLPLRRCRGDKTKCENSENKPTANLEQAQNICPQ
jgi:hypothetical protein